QRLIECLYTQGVSTFFHAAFTAHRADAGSSQVSTWLGAVWLAPRPSSSELLQAPRNDCIDWGTQGHGNTGNPEHIECLLQTRIVPEAARQILVSHRLF